MNNYIILHPKFIKSRKKLQKVFVFDFDETLGSFGDLYYLWTAIVNKTNNSNFQLFKSIMDLYPEFLRYGILVILEFIYYKKKQGKCHKIFLYTNNKCTNDLVNMVIQYISSKIPNIINDIPLFDKIIYAFKINNKVIEIDRTTNKKTYDDLIKCTILSKNTEICFMDDTYHSNMIHNKIYYIQPRPYYHGLSKKMILFRLSLSKLLKYEIYNEIEKKFNTLYINDFLKTENDKKIDILISQKIMYYTKEFFYIINSQTKTHKKTSKIGKFTRKIKITRNINSYDLPEHSILIE